MFDLLYMFGCILVTTKSHNKNLLLHAYM
jgi:hypothetical protein